MLAGRTTPSTNGNRAKTLGLEKATEAMWIKEITHERVRNLGNFESVRVSLTAVIEDGDDCDEVLSQLKSEAKRFLYPKEEQHVEPTTYKKQPGHGIQPDEVDELDY